MSVPESVSADARDGDARADAAHDHSCSCGDRLGHEAEDGSDYGIPSVP